MITPLFFLFFLLITPVFSELHEFFFQGFKHAKPNITINGEAEIQNNGIVCLTHNQDHSIGRAFYSSPVKLKNSSYGKALSFSTSFAFAVKSRYPKVGGDGFAFTISTSKELLGASANEYLGLLNQTSDGNPSNHIFAVEFDTFKNSELGDIDYNHVGIDINSLRSKKSVPAAYFRDGSSRTRRTELLLNSGEVIQAWVDYDSTKNLLEVRLSPFSTKPMSPILSFHVDLSPIFKDYMYVGFSSSTGVLVNSHYILGWSFNMSGEAKSFTSLPSLHHGSKSNDTKVLVGVSVSVVLFIIAAIAMYFCIIRKKMKADEMEPWELQVGPHRYSYQELKIATKGFRQQELLGVGGFGMVYKGTLPKCKTQVAVKRILHESKQGLREFLTEIASIGRLRHKNLVQLLGWCRREGDLLIVYDYMPNGSLDKYLFDEPKAILSWEQRFKIIKDVGYGLLYLHEEWEETVIHRDVKAGNVLLDGELNGKLGDFGLAKLYERGSNPITTKVVGTLGYLAPELTKTGKPTTSSDVFAFGAFLLEVVCGMKPIEPKALPEELFLVDWVWEKWRKGAVPDVVDKRLSGEKWRKGAVPDVVDKRLSGEFDEVEAVWVVKLGLMCSNNAPNARPSMRQAMRYLEGEAALPDVIAAPDGCEGKTISFGGDGGKLKEFLHSSLQGSSYSEKSTLSFGGEREDNDIEASSVSSVSLSGGMEVTKQQRNKLP